MKPKYDMCMERERVLHLILDYMVLYTTKNTVVSAENEGV